MPQGNFRFGDWVAYPDELELRSETRTERLEPKTMSVLALLASRAPQVVSIEELIDGAWSGTVVGDSAVYRAITVLRRALGDSARNSTYIESISRKGYRLKSGVEFLAKVQPSGSQKVNGKQKVLGHLIVAIRFGETMVDEPWIGTAIARYLGWTADAFRVQLWPADLSASDYVLNLHLTKVSEGTELTWELLECGGNTLIFASNDRQILAGDQARLLRIAETVADGISEQIRRHKTQQIIQEARDTAAMNYWELILTSDQFDGMEWSSVQLREARLARACALFDALAPAHAAYADLLSWQVLNGLAGDMRDASSAARHEASKAIELDRDSPYVLSRCGAVFARLGEYARGVELCKRARDLAPSASSKEALARALCFAGDPDSAIPLFQEIHETMPRGHVFRYGKLVVPLVQAGRLEEARDYSCRYISNYPGDYYAWVLHCNILFQLGEIDDGLNAWKEVRRLAPSTSLDNIIAGTNRTYGRNEAQIKYLTGGLRELKLHLMEHSAL